MKHCKVLIEPIAESEDKKKGMKTYNMWKRKRKEILSFR